MIRSVLLLLILCGAEVSANVFLDPTRPPQRMTVEQLNPDSDAAQDEGTAVDGIPNAVVTAIFVTESNRYAIINSDMVEEGEAWRNVLLTKINSDSIELSNGDNRKIIKIFKTDVAKERDYVY